MEAIFKADLHRYSDGFVASFPAFSNEQLIRCSECDFHYIDDADEPPYDMCERHYNKYGEHMRILDLSFYCGFGKRESNV